MEILVSVVNQKLKIPANLKSYVEGSQKFVKFIFDFSDEWNDLLVFAQFKQNGNAYNSYLDSNNCVYLPPEIVAGACTITLYGTDGDVIATTGDAEITIGENSLISDAYSTDISSSLYSQMSTKYNELNNWKTSIENDAPLHWIDL